MVVVVMLPKPPRLPKMPSPLPMDLEGNVKLGVKTLIALLVTVVAGVASLTGLWSTIPTKGDLEKLFVTHEADEQAHPQITKALRDIQSKSVLTDARTQRLEENQKDTQDDVTYIRARIDFLTEHTVRETAVRASGGRRAGEAAVQRLRSGESPDEALAAPAEP
jgi:hypothetical protein